MNLPFQGGKSGLGKIKTWYQIVKSLTGGLIYIITYKLPGLSPQDEFDRRLKTLNDTTQNRLHWLRFIHSSSSYLRS